MQPVKGALAGQVAGRVPRRGGASPASGCKPLCFFNAMRAPTRVWAATKGDSIRRSLALRRRGCVARTHTSSAARPTRFRHMLQLRVHSPRDPPPGIACSSPSRAASAVAATASRPSRRFMLGPSTFTILWVRLGPCQWLASLAARVVANGRQARARLVSAAPSLLLTVYIASAATGLLPSLFLVACSVTTVTRRCLLLLHLLNTHRGRGNIALHIKTR